MIQQTLEVIDAHCHIYPPKIAERAVGGTDAFYGVKSHCDGTLQGLRQANPDGRIDRFIVQSVATSPKQVRSINEFIASEVAISEGRLYGLGTLHPNSNDMEADFEHLLSLGLKGVKLHPDIQNFKIDDFRCLKIYELCEKAHLPILMHTGDSRYDNSNPNRLLPVMEIYSDLVLVGAHFGGWSIWEEASRKLCGLKNLYVDCSSSFPFLSKAAAQGIIRRYGANRVLFGSDYPMWNPADELDTLLSLSLEREELAMILSENAKRVFGI